MLRHNKPLSDGGDTIQPLRTLALACPGIDYIRLWPLPIQQPWDEDWWEIVDEAVRF